MHLTTPNLFILLVFLFFTYFSLTTHLPFFIRSVRSSTDYSLFFSIRPVKRFGLQLFYLHLKHLHLDLQLHYLLRILISMLCYMNPTSSMRYYLITAQYGVLFRVYSITAICCLLQCYYQLLQCLLHVMFWNFSHFNCLVLDLMLGKVKLAPLLTYSMLLHW